MEGKRTTTLMVIMCLVILGLNVNSATAAHAAGGSDFICKNTCCFPCILADPGSHQTHSIQFICNGYIPAL
ncbi:hypothetical protein HU200_015832 [Digitaria exilis]|uniref:Uncharacterized protein n=1 Tax=Digitaria exilis TaxID=1010633 RepID=A0A835F8X8_9POAL|nr:hypothetical protein HU200_015832 [Digitaria exilis]